MWTRFVIINSKLGVYLGPGQPWSKEAGSKPDSAPTFASPREGNQEIVAQRLDGHLLLVRCEGERATSDEISMTPGLEGWT